MGEGVGEGWGAISGKHQMIGIARGLLGWFGCGDEATLEAGDRMCYLRRAQDARQEQGAAQEGCDLEPHAHQGQQADDHHHARQKGQHHRRHNMAGIAPPVHRLLHPHRTCARLFCLPILAGPKRGHIEVKREPQVNNIWSVLTPT